MQRLIPKITTLILVLQLQIQKIVFHSSLFGKIWLSLPKDLGYIIKHRRVQASQGFVGFMWLVNFVTCVFCHMFLKS